MQMLLNGENEYDWQARACGQQAHSLFWSRPDGQLHVQWYRAGSVALFPPHCHAEFNIVVSLRGAVETTQLGFVETAAPGEAMMGSHPGVEHSSRYLVDGTGCEAVSLTFSSQVLRQVDATWPHDAVQPAFLGKIQSGTVWAAARDVAQELRCQEMGFGVVLEGLAMRILIETLRAWPRNRVEQVAAESHPCLSRRDHVRAVEFMRWCRKDEFRLQTLCRFLGAGEEKFARLFRASTGDSPASFYNRLLLDRAAGMVAENGLSIKEAGYQLGFRTPSHFVAAFRRQYGVTPMEYRRRSRPRGFNE